MDTNKNMTSIRKIRKVTVLGSGVMGSRIACHFANIGLDVLLLDLKSQDSNQKVEVADQHLQAALKSNPSPIYSKDFAKRPSIS